MLALYTDGLVERAGQDIGTGMSRLARALAATPVRSLDQMCDSVLTRLATHARDDITLLLVRTTALLQIVSRGEEAWPRSSQR